MKKVGKFISKNKTLVLIVAIILLIPCLFGYIKTKVNYDILTYLPKNLDSTKGQELLNTTFNDASTSMLIIENMESKDIAKLKDKIKAIDGVEDAIWINDVLDISIPKEILPDDIKDAFFSNNSTMIIIRYENPASSDETMNAISEVRGVLNKQCFLSGIAAIIKDTKDLADKEAPLYILIAVIFSLIVMLLTMESTIVPFIFLLGILFAVIYNMGTNIFLGSISYITKSIAGILQLGVTMDYSIFLLHRYDEEKEKYDNREDAMAEAITNTFNALLGSSLTTVAGFLALCFMQLTIGKDIGIVMVKGVIIGVLTVVTVLPSLILFFDKPIHKYTHKTILPEFNKTSKIITTKYAIFVGIFIVLFIPAIYGQSHTDVYYNLDESLPDSLPSVIATNKLKDEYNMSSTHFIMVDSKLPSYKVNEMVKKIEAVDGIEKVISYDKYIGPTIPDSFIPKDIKEIFKKDDYQLIIANSKYKAARDDENSQIDEVVNIVKSYDEKGIVAGEGPLTKDLIETANVDFKVTGYISIIAIFIIILFVFKSLSVPVILVAAIELAIFINMAIPFYTGVSIPFIASIVIGCIQLGATVDYAILLTTRFQEEVLNGLSNIEAMEIASRSSAKSIMTSALVFFASTGGVALISNIEMIKSLCEMMARGAIISMAVILFILPSILIVSEKAIVKTSKGWAVGQK